MLRKLGLLCFIPFVLTVSSLQAKPAAIASAHPLATEAGFEILAQGGNAFDAAVAVSAALAVVEPAGSGLGGGGFWLLHRAKDGFETMIDGREKAPLAAHQGMYLDENGVLIPRLSKDGALSAGIPGMPAALVHLSKKYGRLSLSESLRPAIRYARAGFPIGLRHRKLLGFRLKVLQQFPETSAIFLANQKIPELGAILRQTDLAYSLEMLAVYGQSGFYQGQIARRLVKAVQQAGGIWTLKDLENYQIIERQPITGEYRGIKVTSASLPSSGGVVLIEALNILSAFDLSTVNAITRQHLIAEAMRHAYHDRARYLGDSDFVTVPLQRLLNKDYALGRASSIRLDKALSSEQLAGDSLEKQGGEDTTHFSVMDGEGNRVSATLSVNFPFGSGMVAKGTGVLLNDEMDDFVSQVGQLNGYGLTGGQANTIVAEKRMLSSMTPTFLEDEHRVAVLGTPGGSRIISMVLLATLDFADGHPPESWVSLPRFHHQYIPDRIQYEKAGLTATEIEKLTALGHQLNEVRYNYGNMQAILWNKQTQNFLVASDPRGEGLASVK